VNSRPRRLGGEDFGFTRQHALPAGVDLGARGDPGGEAQEDLVVAEFGAEQSLVEPGEFGVGTVLCENGEALARARLDEGGDEEAVEHLGRAAAFANHGAKLVGVRILMDAREAAASFEQEPRDLGEVGGFIAGHVGHGLDPAGDPVAGPTRHHVHGVIGGLLFEEGVIDEESDGVGEHGLGP